MQTLKIQINPDEEFVKNIREKIEINSGYCPCKIEKSEDTKCMCKDFLEQTNSGWCHCHLYYKLYD